MIIYVARHGQTDYNLQSRYTGNRDIPLNETGKKQAEQLGKTLAQIPFDVIVSSTLLRARQTAEAAAKYHPGVPVIYMEDFIEISMGVYEGLTREEAREQYPEIWKNRSNQEIDHAIEGGESLRQCDVRVQKGFERLRQQFPDSTVLLVCHGCVARSLNRQLKHLTFEQMFEFLPNNCEAVKYLV